MTTDTEHGDDVGARSLIEADKRELAGPDKVNELYFLLLTRWNGIDELIATTRDKIPHSPT